MSLVREEDFHVGSQNLGFLYPKAYGVSGLVLGHVRILTVTRLMDLI
jgi:hypothetical protein